MKIIEISNNYADRVHEVAGASLPVEPIVSMRPDSSLLRDGKPFFLADGLGEVCAEGQLVVRICRLGKCVSPRFAPRYYDAVTVGVAFAARTLRDGLQQAGLPWEASTCFDGSTVLGNFQSLDGADVQNLRFSLSIDGQTVQQAVTADMLFGVDQLIAHLSRYMTLKIGDLLFTGTPAGAVPVRIGQHLQGCIGDTPLLDFHVR